MILFTFFSNIIFCKCFLKVGRGRLGEAQAHNWKTKLLSFWKSLEVSAQLPSAGDLLLTSLVNLMRREIKQVGSGVSCQARTQLGDNGTKKAKIGLGMGSVSQKCTAKAVSGVLLIMES